MMLRCEDSEQGLACVSRLRAMLHASRKGNSPCLFMDFRVDERMVESSVHEVEEKVFYDKARGDLPEKCPK
jgi:hypothetical protein